MNPIISKDIYSELHHIIPKSLGGKRGPNLIRLTPKEHFICHLLLTKIYPHGSPSWKKMILAFKCMNMRTSRQHGRYSFDIYGNSRLYTKLREEFIKIQQKNTWEPGTHPTCNTISIYSLELCQNKLIKNDTEIPFGWKRGRCNDFSQVEYYNDLYSIYNNGGFSAVKLCGYTKTYTALLKQFKKYVKHYCPVLSHFARRKLENPHLDIISYYNTLYEIYKIGGFNLIKSETDYDMGHTTLLGQFKKYLPNYTPPFK